MLRDFQEIKARHARGNSPEVKARIEAARAHLPPGVAARLRSAKAKENEFLFTIEQLRGTGRLYVP